MSSIAPMGVDAYFAINSDIVTSFNVNIHKVNYHFLYFLYFAIGRFLADQYQIDMEEDYHLFMDF